MSLLKLLQSDPKLLEMALYEPGRAAQLLAKKGITIHEEDLREIQDVQKPDTFGDILGSLQAMDYSIQPPAAPSQGHFQAPPMPAPPQGLGDILGGLL